MKLKVHELELHAIFFFSSLIGHNLILDQSKLDFIKIEFQNRDIFLNFLINKGKMLESPRSNRQK